MRSCEVLSFTACVCHDAGSFWVGEFAVLFDFGVKVSSFYGVYYMILRSCLQISQHFQQWAMAHINYLELPIIPLGKVKV